MKVLGVDIETKYINTVEIEKNKNNIEILNKKQYKFDIVSKKEIEQTLSKEYLKEFDKVFFSGSIPEKIFKINTFSNSKILEESLKYVNIPYSEKKVIVNLDEYSIAAYVFDNRSKFEELIIGDIKDEGFNDYYGDINSQISSEFKLYKNKNIFVDGKHFLECKDTWNELIEEGKEKQYILEDIAEKIAYQIEKLVSNLDYDRLILIGKNTESDLLINKIKNKAENVYVPEHSKHYMAYMSAVYGTTRKNKKIKSIDELLNKSEVKFTEYEKPLNSFIRSIKTHDIKFEEKENNRPKELILAFQATDKKITCVALNAETKKIVKRYKVKIKTNPILATKELLIYMKNLLFDGDRIIGMGVYGKNKEIISKYLKDAKLVKSFVPSLVKELKIPLDLIFHIEDNNLKYYKIKGNRINYKESSMNLDINGKIFKDIVKNELNLNLKDINHMLINADRSPVFSSKNSISLIKDVKAAIKEHISKENILSSTSYALARHFLDKFNANDSMKYDVLFLGEYVSYHTIPLAFSSIIDSNINVYSETDYLSIYGVALSILEKTKLKKDINLDFIIEQKIKEETSFMCNGGVEKCDQKCNIDRIIIDEKMYSYGGKCSKFKNLLIDLKEINFNNIDYIKKINDITFKKYRYEEVLSYKKNKKIAISKSFLMYKYFPFYYNFFKSLGFDVELVSNKSFSDDFSCPSANFYYSNINGINADYYLFAMEEDKNASKCCLMQGESSYLKKLLGKEKMLVSIIRDQNIKLEDIEYLAYDVLGLSEDVKEAFKFAKDIFKNYLENIEKLKAEYKNQIKNHKSVVLYGKYYNILNEKLNKDVVHKFLTENIIVAPSNFLTKDEFYECENVYPVYVGNSTCQDDYIKSIEMDYIFERPYLKLENIDKLSSENIDLEIDIFLNNIEEYDFKKKNKNKLIFKNQGINFTDENIEVIIPNLCDIESKMISSSLRSLGINAKNLSSVTKKDIEKGKKVLNNIENDVAAQILGNVINYIDSQNDTKKRIVYIPTHSKSYKMKRILKIIKHIFDSHNILHIDVRDLDFTENEIECSNNMYKKMWQTSLIIDVVLNLKLQYETVIKDKVKFEIMFEELLKDLAYAVEHQKLKGIMEVLNMNLEKISKIKRDKKYKKVLLLGDSTYIRNKYLNKKVIENLQNRNIMPQFIPEAVYMQYLEIFKNVDSDKLGFKEKIKDYAESFFKKQDKKIILNTVKQYLIEDIKIDDFKKVIDKMDEVFVNEFISEAKYMVSKSLIEEDFDAIIVLGYESGFDAQYTYNYLKMEINKNILYIEVESKISDHELEKLNKFLHIIKEEENEFEKL